MSLSWFSLRHEGAILPLGRYNPAVVFQFTPGHGGVGAFSLRTPQGLQAFQVGQVPVGNGLTKYKTAQMPNSQSGLPLFGLAIPKPDLTNPRAGQTDRSLAYLDFLSLGLTPQGALPFPSIVRTAGSFVSNTVALQGVFGTVADVRTNGLDGYLVATAPSINSLTDTNGGEIKAGINYVSRSSIFNAPAEGYPAGANGEFAPLQNFFAYPDGSTQIPLYAVLNKTTYYLIEADDSSGARTYRISTFDIASKVYTAGPKLSVTPLGLNWCSDEDPGFLVMLGFQVAGTRDALYKLTPGTGVAELLTVVAPNDPLAPHRRQGLYFFGRDPSSSLDQFVVIDGDYQNLVTSTGIDAEGNTIPTVTQANPTGYFLITAIHDPAAKDGPPLPGDVQLPITTPGDPLPEGFPKAFFPPPRRGTRDFPSSFSKWVPYKGPFTAKTFNTLMDIIAGGNGPLWGITIVPNTGNTQANVVLGPLGGAFMVNGISVFYPPSASIPSIPIAGSAPYAVTAFTPDETDLSSVTFQVEAYNPTALEAKCILAHTDSSGSNWTNTPPMGLQQLMLQATTKQLTDAEVALLLARDGTIDVADTLHRHRVPISQTAFETLTNHDYTKVPHPPKSTPPVAADQLHTHVGVMTDFEAEALTSRNGVTSADSQHTHDDLPPAAAYDAVFGGPDKDASNYHSHPQQGHGVISNPRATKIYVPQNVGTGQAFVNAVNSTFTGSVALILGESSPGSGVNRVTGVRYKEFALFFHSTLTAGIGGGTAGLAATEVQELFGPDNPSGVLAAAPFGEVFTWRGIQFQVSVPSVGAVPFVLPSTNRPNGDFFTAHGVIAATIDKAGVPAIDTLMEEGLLSRLGVRYAVVPDERYPGGGYLTLTLS